MTAEIQRQMAAATGLIADRVGGKTLGNGPIKGIEAGKAVNESDAVRCATVIDEAVRVVLFGAPPTQDVRLKTAKPDTFNGWETVQLRDDWRAVPVFLHHRHYRGAFRQLLDASTKRGDLLEDAVEELFEDQGVPFIERAPTNRRRSRPSSGITVKPAPDFVVFDAGETA